MRYPELIFLQIIRCAKVVFCCFHRVSLHKFQILQIDSCDKVVGVGRELSCISDLQLDTI